MGRFYRPLGRWVQGQWVELPWQEFPGPSLGEGAYAALFARLNQLPEGATGDAIDYAISALDEADGDTDFEADISEESEQPAYFSSMIIRELCACCGATTNVTEFAGGRV